MHIVCVTKCICTLCLCCCMYSLRVTLVVFFRACTSFDLLRMCYVLWFRHHCETSLQKRVREGERKEQRPLACNIKRKEEIKSGTSGCGSFVVPYFQPATSTTDHLHIQGSRCLLVICVNRREKLRILRQWHEKGVQYNIELTHITKPTWLIDDRLYSAILRSREQTHCARMWCYMSD